MYTGIVLGTERIEAIEHHDGFHTIFVSNQKGFMNDAFIGQVLRLMVRV